MRTKSLARFLPATSAARRLPRRRARASLIETLEQRVLLDANILGSLDVASRTTIAGWAWDRRVPNSALNVQISIDGTPQTVSANATRNDLGSFLGSTNHGYVIAAPTLAPGAHHVIASAVDPFTMQTVVIGEKDIVNNAPIGVANFNASTAWGWAYDADAGANPIQVRIDVNGATAQTVTANTTRNDLTSYLGSPNHGFAVSGDFANKVVELVALDNNSGVGTILKSNNVRSIGSMDILNRSRVLGWAYDGNHGASAIQVRIEVDGQTFTTVSANNTRNDLTSYLGSADHGYDVALTSLAPGSHSVKVYARDPDSLLNDEVLLGEGTINSPAPIGSLDVTTSSTVAGWAFDSDAGATPIGVKIKIDGATVASVNASLTRNDLIGYVGSANHGFNVSLSNLAAGPHSIQLYGVDVPSNTDYLISTKVIDNQLPIGHLDVANLTQIFGWAADRDPTPGDLTVKLVIDGVNYGQSIANLTRNDLTSYLGSPNHGFRFTTPVLGFGQHQVQIYAVDTFTAQDQLIGQMTVTNRQPFGSFDLATASRVAGWAFDYDAGSTPIDILIARDNVIIQRVTANLTRNDLTPYFGSPNHGFDVSLTPVTGTHVYTIYAVDPMGVTAQIGQRTVTA